MPHTLHLSASNAKDIAHAAELLQRGGIVAFPTETVYGLGADALSPDAVARIFKAKARPSWDPLIVHVAEFSDVISLVDLSEGLTSRVEALAQACWPGPLTLLLPRRAHIPDAVTAGRSLVGVRVPAHPAAQALLWATKLPLAAPSANRFGHTSPTTAQHVLEDLDGRIDAVLDDGSTSIGVESTVVDPTSTPMVLYRPGAFTPQDLERITGTPVRIFQPSQMIEMETAARETLPAPGVGLRHYAPNARLIVVEGSVEALERAVSSSQSGANEIGILLPEDWKFSRPELLIERWGKWNDAESLAATLFSGLRSLDARGARVIYSPLPEPGGLRDAIRDRLQKAARTA